MGHVIAADHRHLTAGTQAASLQRKHRAHRHQVVGADQSRGRLRQVEQPACRVEAVLLVHRGFDEVFGRLRQAGFLQGLLVSGQPMGAVGERQGGADQRDAPVAQCNQAGRSQPAGLAMVDIDESEGLARFASAQGGEGEAATLKIGDARIILGPRPGEDQSVDPPPFDEAAEHGDFVVAGVDRRDQHVETLRLHRVVDALDQLQEERVGEMALRGCQQHADGAGASQPQAHR